MKHTFLSAMMGAALALGGCARNAVLEITMDLPADGTEVTSAETSHPVFQAHGALVAFMRTPPGDTKSWSYANARERIDLSKWERSKDTLGVEVGSSFEDPLYVIVRLCAAVDDCTAAAVDSVLYRDFVWRVDHPHYKGVTTTLTLPVPNGASYDDPTGLPDDRTTPDDDVAHMFGCILDDWSYLLSQEPPSRSSQPNTPVIEINRCMVNGCNRDDGWSCNVPLVSHPDGTSMYYCTEPTVLATAVHMCE